MPEVVYARAIERILERARTRPELFASVVVVSPYIDRFGLALLESVAAGTAGSSVLRVVTRTEARAFVARHLGTSPSVRLSFLDRLHAKVYATLGLLPRDHEAIVTSANLTRAGLYRNHEVGVRILGWCESDAALVERIVKLSTEAPTPPGGPSAWRGRQHADFGN